VTRKDYILIAEAIHSQDHKIRWWLQHPIDNDTEATIAHFKAERTAIAMVTLELMQRLYADNPRFIPDRFRDRALCYHTD